MKVFPIVRASMMIGAVTALAINITLAAQQSSATLIANTAASATFNLSLSKDGLAFADSFGGYDFNHIVPGVTGSSQPIHLKNESDVPMNISLAVPHIPTFNGIAQSGVRIAVTRTDVGKVQDQQVVAQLFSNFTPAGGVTFTDPLDSGATGDYNIIITFDKDAVTGETATVSGFDFVFTGTQP